MPSPSLNEFLTFTNAAAWRVPAGASGCRRVLTGASGRRQVPVGASGCHWKAAVRPAAVSWQSAVRQLATAQC